MSEHKEKEKKYKILVTCPEIPQNVLDLMAHDAELIICESIPCKRSEVLAKIKGVHAIFWRIAGSLDVEILDAAGPQLKAISTVSVGFDHIDVNECKPRNIKLGYTPNASYDSVADIAIGLTMAAARRFHEARLMVETGTWENFRFNWMLGQDLYQAVVGFFGFGGIAQAIAKRLAGFDIGRIVYTTRRRVALDIEQKFNATKVDFNVMLAESDFVFIAAPLTQETAGIFNADAFSKMKKNAVFVNIARGGLVNHEDLYVALKTNQIFAAGLDVAQPEPLLLDDPLLTLPNLVILPHIGATTIRARHGMSMFAAQNILRGLADEPMLAPIY